MPLRFLKVFSLAAGLRVLRLLIGLAIASQLARFLGSEGFGQLSIAMYSITILLCVGELGFARYTVRQLVAKDRPEAEVLGSTLALRMLASLLLFGGLAAYLLIAQPKLAPLLWIYGVQLLSNPCTEIMAWFEARKRLDRLVIAQFIGFLVSAVFIAIGIWKQAPLYYFAITYAIEGWTFFAIGIVWFRRAGGRIHFNRGSIRHALPALQQSWPELASQLALILLFRIDTIMVGALRGDQEAGLYSAATRISELVYFIPTILASLCLPRLVELHTQKAPEYRSRVTDYFSLSIAVSLALAAALALASPVVHWIFGPAFVGSAAILAIHAWSFVPYSIGVARTQYLTVENRLWVNLPSVGGALGINLLLNALWIPRYGGVGAAWATLISYTLAWMVSSFILPGAARDLGRLISNAARQLPSLTLRTVQRSLSQAR